MPKKVTAKAAAAAQRSSTGSAPTGAAAAVPAPEFPPIEPDPYVDAGLQHTDVLDDQIIVLESFFSKQTRRAYLSFLQQGVAPLLQPPSATTRRGEALRTNYRYSVHSPAFARRLYVDSGLRDFCLGHAQLRSIDGSPLQLCSHQKDAKAVTAAGKAPKGAIAGLNPNIRVYRYTRGEKFETHYDDSVAADVDVHLCDFVAADDGRHSDSDDAAREVAAGQADGAVRTDSTTDSVAKRKCKSAWTLLIYLLDPASPLVGGETSFDVPAHLASSLSADAPLLGGLPLGSGSGANGSGGSGNGNGSGSTGGSIGGSGGGGRKHARSAAVTIAPPVDDGMALLHRHGEHCLPHRGEAVVDGIKWVIRSDLMYCA